MFRVDAESLRLKKIYRAILNGVTCSNLAQKTCYIKHLGIEDEIVFDEYFLECFERAKSRGLPTEEESFSLIRKEGTWSDEDEQELYKQKQFVEGQQRYIPNIKIPSQLEKARERLLKEESKLREMESKKSDLIGETCEKYATNKLNNYYIYRSLFSNQECTEPFYKQEDYDDLSRQEIFELSVFYSSIVSEYSIANLKKISIAPFFRNYFTLCSKDLVKFCGKTIHDMTYFQCNLFSYALLYDNIFENHNDIPEHISSDPEKIIDWVQARKRGEEILQKSNNADAVGIVGAKRKDLDMMGLTQNRKSASDFAKEKGGSFKTSDFVN